MAQEELYQREVEESTIDAWFFVSRKIGPGDTDFTPGKRINFPNLLKSPELDIDAVARWRSALAVDGPGAYVFGNGVKEEAGTGFIELGGPLQKNTEINLNGFQLNLLNGPIGNILLGNQACQVDIFSKTNGQSGGIQITGFNNSFNHYIGSTIKYEIPSTNTRIYMEDGYMELQSKTGMRFSVGDEGFQYVGIPTSSTGLPAGHIYRDASGFLKIV